MNDHCNLSLNSRFSIDQHELTVVEADGYPVKPVKVESLLGFMGERFVVEFTADQSIKKYWIRAKVVRTGIGKPPQHDGRDDEVLAVLQYEGAVGGEPETSPINCTESKPCDVLNCPWTTYHKEWYPNRECIPISDLRLDTNIYDAKVDTTNTPNSPIFEIFLNFGFPIGSSINKIKNVMPRAPLFQEPSTWGTEPCSSDCSDKGCLCSHVIALPPNRTIQMVLTSNTLISTEKNGTINVITTMHHPVHIHGHSFQVRKFNIVKVPVLRPSPDAELLLRRIYFSFSRLRKRREIPYKTSALCLEPGDDLHQVWFTNFF